MDGDTILPDFATELRRNFDPRCLPKLRADPSQLVKYVMVELDVPRGNHIEFQNLMRPLVEIMFDLKHWELVFAAYPIVGIVNRFVHIWRIPDESTIVEIMREGAQADVATPSGDNDLQEEFRQVYQAVQGLITYTKHTLLTSLPYDPTHVGFQTHTIVVDANGDKFSLNHERLRAEGRDLSDELELARRKRDKVRTTTKVAGAKERSTLTVETPTTREQQLSSIQEHLNRGASVARVKLGEADGNNEALLFNLASLKPKSVFQELDQKFAGEGAPPQGHPVMPTVDFPVASLLIAAPWGGVYQLTPNELGAISTYLKHPDVDAALKPLIDGEVPLAAVPEERDTTIGDGCACFIINLSSFCHNSK
jgi:hypothetical protein